MPTDPRDRRIRELEQRCDALGVAEVIAALHKQSERLAKLLSEARTSLATFNAEWKDARCRDRIRRIDRERIHREQHTGGGE